MKRFQLIRFTIRANIKLLIWAIMRNQKQTLLKDRRRFATVLYSYSAWAILCYIKVTALRYV